MSGRKDLGFFLPSKATSLLVTLASICMALLGLLFLAGNNLPDPDFWWDEAGQFWMSQGQNHMSQFDTPVSPLTQGLT